MPKTLTLFSLIVLLSCNQKETNENANNAIPKALQEESEDLKRYSKSTNLTEELYEELVANNVELKNLETAINAFNPQEVKDKFYTFDKKSTNYYYSAKNLANGITDSITKNKIKDLIKKSSEKYAGKTAELHQLLKSINQKENAIQDYHNILKIVLTLELIKKFQTENLPNKSDFENVINKQNKLIEETKKRTPNY